MSKKNDKETMQERIERMKREKEEAQKAGNDNKSAIISQLAHEQVATNDFEKMAKVFESLQKNKKLGANEGYTKDTLYIENSLYKAFNALCVNRGDKKKYVNAAIEDFVKKKYKELREQK